MPSITDKLKAEERNDQTIRLWPEGKFYKAYERSAYLFVTRLRHYEARRRYVDVVGHDVVSIGFPQSVLDGLGSEHSTAADGAEVIRLESSLDEQAFMLWREELKVTVSKVVPSAPAPAPLPAPVTASASKKIEASAMSLSPPLRSEESAVVMRLREFNLVSATPLDCLLLVSELQKMIREAG